jgi:hypothetical protein
MEFILTKQNKLPSFIDRCWQVGKRNEMVRILNKVVAFGFVFLNV